MPRLSVSSSEEEETLTQSPEPKLCDSKSEISVNENQPSVDSTTLCKQTEKERMILTDSYFEQHPNECDVDNDVETTNPMCVRNSSRAKPSKKTENGSEMALANGGKTSKTSVHISSGGNTTHNRGLHTHTTSASPIRQLRKRYTASDELDVIQLQTARDEPSSDPAMLLKLYQVLSLGYALRYTSSPYIRDILSKPVEPSEAQNYRRSYILEASS